MAKFTRYGTEIRFSGNGGKKLFEEFMNASFDEHGWSEEKDNEVIFSAFAAGDHERRERSEFRNALSYRTTERYIVTEHSELFDLKETENTVSIKLISSTLLEGEETLLDHVKELYGKFADEKQKAAQPTR